MQISSSGHLAALQSLQASVSAANSHHHQLALGFPGSGITTMAGQHQLHHHGGLGALGLNGAGLGGLAMQQGSGGAGGQFSLAGLGLPSGVHRGLTGPHANLMAHPLLGLSSNPGGSGGLLSGANHGGGAAAALLSAAAAANSGGQPPGSNILLLPKLP
jgi:hypothetical protein